MDLGFNDPPGFRRWNGARYGLPVRKTLPRVLIVSLHPLQLQFALQCSHKGTPGSSLVPV